jgi:type III pantothenate kinase
VFKVTEVALLIDQGNTRLKWVLARCGEIDEKSAGQGDFDAFKQTCRHEAFVEPDTVLISSVAGIEDAQTLVGFCESQWGRETQMLVSTKQRGGVRNAYPEPEMLGVDRWLAIVGAVARYGKPVVIWDLGTATTLDAVDETGQHLGGMIYPGPATMLDSLRRDTKLRVPANLENAGVIPGRSTADCISNGIFAAQLGALNQFLRKVSDEMGRQPEIVVTGGAATWIVPMLDFETIHDPWLVFRGMLID